MSLPLDPLAGGTVFKPPPEELPELLLEDWSCRSCSIDWSYCQKSWNRCSLHLFLSPQLPPLLFLPPLFRSLLGFPTLFLGLDDRVFFLIQPCQLGILLFD